MFYMGLGMICFTIYAIVEEICDYLKEKSKQKNK